VSHVSWARPLWPGCPLATQPASTQESPWPAAEVRQKGAMGSVGQRQQPGQVGPPWEAQ
jgi:hypothetical protein